jgi:hypothetical protein
LFAGTVFLVFASPALAQDDLRETARSLFEPIPEQPPELPGLQATPERVELGKMLYFETRLSVSHTISCNSCHMVGLGGVDMLETSIGHRWQMGARNSPTVLNAVFNSAQFWDGRAADLVEQAGGPLENPVEMATTHAHVVEMLNATPGYVELLAKAFPDDPDPINIENTLGPRRRGDARRQDRVRDLRLFARERVHEGGDLVDLGVGEVDPELGRPHYRDRLAQIPGLAGVEVGRRERDVPRGGNDSLTDGPGRDLYLYYARVDNGDDTITDFDGAEDTILLDGSAPPMSTSRRRTGARYWSLVGAAGSGCPARPRSRTTISLSDSPARRQRASSKKGAGTRIRFSCLIR